MPLLIVMFLDIVPPVIHIKTNLVKARGYLVFHVHYRKRDKGSDCDNDSWYESECVGDQCTHVAVETEVVQEVETQSTADVVELKKIIDVINTSHAVCVRSLRMV